MLTRFDCRRYAREAYDLGVRYIGGCCGFEPYHIREIAEEVTEFSSETIIQPFFKDFTFVAQCLGLCHLTHQFSIFHQFVFLLKYLHFWESSNPGRFSSKVLIVWNFNVYPLIKAIVAELTTTRRFNFLMESPHTSIIAVSARDRKTTKGTR